MASSKRFREVLGLTQKDLADILQISVRTVENWELRDSLPEYVEVLLWCLDAAGQDSFTFETRLSDPRAYKEWLETLFDYHAHPEKYI